MSSSDLLKDYPYTKDQQINCSRLLTQAEVAMNEMLWDVVCLQMCAVLELSVIISVEYLRGRAQFPPRAQNKYGGIRENFWRQFFASKKPV